MRTPICGGAYMYEQSTLGFGVRIWGRKYLNECTPFSGVRQCTVTIDTKHTFNSNMSCGTWSFSW